MSAYEGDGDTAAEQMPSRGDLRDVEVRRAGRPNQTPPVAEALDRLNKMVRMTEDALESLGEKVSPVLGPMRPTTSLGEARPPQEDMSEVTARLHSLADGLSSIHGRLREYAERIEL